MDSTIPYIAKILTGLGCLKLWEWIGSSEILIMRLNVCSLVVGFLTDTNSIPTKTVFNCFGLFVGFLQQTFLLLIFFSSMFPFFAILQDLS